MRPSMQPVFAPAIRDPAESPPRRRDSLGGTDLSALSVANVERVEVVRGPFSALYGSEAIGGVVRVFTRRGAAQGEDSGRATLALGTASAKEAFAEIALGSGALTGSAGFRRTLADGDLPNEFFEATNVSASITAALTDALRVGRSEEHTSELQSPM